MVAWYTTLVFAHVASVLLFFFAHGASAFAMLRLAREREIERIRALLDVSKDSRVWLNVSMLATTVTGGALAYYGGFLRAGWIWASVAIFVVLAGVMGFLGTRYFEGVRQAVGLPNGFDKKLKRAPAPADAAEIDRVLSRTFGRSLAAVGALASAALLYLMMVKPF